MNRQRRRALHAGLAIALAGIVHPSKASDPRVEVWKSAGCDCCAGWVKHLEANGFTVKVNDTGNEAVRAKLGIPQRLGSCHTAQVGGFAIEGHVPASDIKRLLAEKPKAIGLAVPGMPIGSPGMEVGDKRDPYDVLLVEHGGGTRTFSSHR